MTFQTTGDSFQKNFCGRILKFSGVFSGENLVSKRKLLLADDSETVRKVVNLTFELEGIEVISFGDGDSAMEQISAIAPDVILADVNMPGIDGYEICRIIKQNEATKQTPVILLVGSFEPFDEEKAMSVGADDYLTKPFQSIRQLVSKVNELLSIGGENGEDDFEETLSGSDSPVFEPVEFGEPGLDDEMIQTSQVGSIPADETTKYSSAPVYQADEDVSKTQPLSADDWREMYPEQSAETEEETVYELAGEDAEPDDPQEIHDTVEMPFEPEKPAVDQGFWAAPEQTSDEEIPTEQEFSVQPEQVETETIASGETDFSEQETQAEDITEMEENRENESEQTPPAQWSPILNFDELDLLEIPGSRRRSPQFNEEKTISENTSDEENQTDSGQIKETVSAQFSAQDFPPEVIDAIAEKVVEKLTARLKE